LSNTLQKYLGNPEIAIKLNYFPISSDGYCKVQILVFITIDNLLLILGRCIANASRWLYDVHFYSPMACMHNGTHVFLRDLIQC